LPCCLNTVDSAAVGRPGTKRRSPSTFATGFGRHLGRSRARGAAGSVTIWGHFQQVLRLRPHRMTTR